jgi:Phage tail protein.
MAQSNGSDILTGILKITIDNGLSSISVGDDGCNFKLISHSGFAAADYDVKAAVSGASDGGYISSARIGTRTLGIKFDFGGSNAESVRQSLISFFTPGRELTVTAQRGRIIRRISGRASDFDISEKNRHARSSVNLSVLCPDPFFKADNTVYVSAAVRTPMFHLPCHFPCVLGVQSSTGDIEIINSGDTFADMVAELAAASSVTAPYILNRTNGKRIKVNNTLGSGEVLTISTVRRAKTAAIGGTRCLIDPTSQFSDFLEVGLNQITYGSDDGSAGLAANVRYTALFYGV